MYANKKVATKTLTTTKSLLSPRSQKNLQKYGEIISSEEEQGDIFTPSDDSTSSNDSDESLQNSDESSDSYDDEKINADTQKISKLLRDLQNITINKGVKKGARANKIKGINKGMEEELLVQEDAESYDTFLLRKELTQKIASMDSMNINYATSLVVASMLVKKSTMGLTYSKNIEMALDYIVSTLDS